MTTPNEREIVAKLKSYDHPSTMCGPIFIEMHTDIHAAADLIERLVKERDNFLEENKTLWFDREQHREELKQTYREREQQVRELVKERDYAKEQAAGWQSNACEINRDAAIEYQALKKKYDEAVARGDNWKLMSNVLYNHDMSEVLSTKLIIEYEQLLATETLCEKEGA